MIKYYFFTFYMLVIANLYSINITEIKINNCLSLINESVVENCISKYSDIEASQNEDITFLYIKQDSLKYKVDYILKENIGYLKYNISYYFYNNKNNNYPIKDEIYCNSVQIKIDINYQYKQIIKIKRFEPILLKEVI